MTIFFLIRHASCSGLGLTLWGRTANITLDLKGELQARSLAERFKEVALDAIYSSPMERALQTAEPLARNANLEVKESPALNEIDFGDWTGKTFEELSSDEVWRRFNTRRSVTTIPSGESFLEVQNRIVKELNALASRHANARVAIVTHADVIRAAIVSFCAIPVDLIERIEISPGSVSVVALDDESVTLLTINNTIDLAHF
jgi:broad specificity phosphatase PhoE